VADDIVHKKEDSSYRLCSRTGVGDQAPRGIYRKETLNEKDAQIVLGVFRLRGIRPGEKRAILFHKDGSVILPKADNGSRLEEVPIKNSSSLAFP